MPSPCRALVFAILATSLLTLCLSSPQGHSSPSSLTRSVQKSKQQYREDFAPMVQSVCLVCAQPLSYTCLQTCSLDTQVSNSTSFYCSTCKRLVDGKHRIQGRKTCSPCLVHKTRSARHRRWNRRGHVRISVGENTRYCSSCKCTKLVVQFEENKKTCNMCRIRRMSPEMYKRAV